LKRSPAVLLPRTSVLVILLAGCTDPGNTLSARTNPAVIFTLPGNKARDGPTSLNSSSNIVAGTAATATFGQPMDLATIDSFPAGSLPTFTLADEQGNSVPGNRRYEYRKFGGDPYPVRGTVSPGLLLPSPLVVSIRDATSAAYEQHSLNFKHGTGLSKRVVLLHDLRREALDSQMRVPVSEESNWRSRFTPSQVIIEVHGQVRHGCD
jgi:hypothetical protein